MTSWNAWFARTQSPMIERRASPGSRARRSLETLPKCCSASPSSTRSSGVILVAATSLASASSSARTMNASCSSSREIVRTRTPRFGTKETRPSAASRRSASRTGVRETSNCSESCSWRRTVPGSSSPETIASSITSAMSSAFVVSRLMRRVYAAPARGRLARAVLPHVALRPCDLDFCLRLQGLGVVDETASLAPRLLTVAQRVSGSQDRLVGPLERFVPRHGQGHEVLELLGKRDRGEELFGLVAGLHELDLVTDTLLVDAPVAHPLPDLGAGDLGRRGVLHQVVDRRRADAVQPRFEVADADG